MSRIALLLLICLPLLAPPCSGAEATFARHPAPSPDGASIAFSWQGDLWLVAAEGGTARRLTVHPATDRNPVWSRDGRWLAFSSNRYGHEDVFVLPLDGSEPPRRLTYASVDDRPTAFRPDGQSVLFNSSRDESFRRGTALYEVAITGGTPWLALPALCLSAAVSPDGGQLALGRGDTRWTRRGYRGAADRDVWLWKGGDDYERLTDFDGDDDDPTWLDGDTLVMRSARSGRKNVFLLDVPSREVKQLTFHDGSDVRFPAVAANGGLIAYEFEDGLWTVSPEGGEPRRLSIDVPTDRLANPVERRVDRSGARELAISPDGKLAAFLIHGDVFLTAVTSKDDQEIAVPPTLRLTDTPQQEADLSWSPDGKALLVTSYSTGSGDLYLLRPAGKEPWMDSFDFTLTRLTQSPAHEHDGRFSPDAKRIAFLRERGDLRLMNADGSGERGIFDHWSAPDFQWSPDGKWLAWSQEDQDHNSEIWIQAVEGQGGEPYNVSRHPDTDESPRWSPDGKRLVWLSRRHADTQDLWGVWLTKKDDERTPQEWLAWFQEQAKKRGKNGKNGNGDKNGDKTEEGDEDDQDKPWMPELPEMSIDFEDLWQRAEAITSLLGNEASPRIAADGKKIFFTAEQGDERDLYSVRWDGQKVERLTQGNTRPRDVQLAGKEETIFFLNEQGVVQRVALDGKAGDPVPFTARYEIDRQQERAVVFEEVWQALAENFYDPDFHGVDWPAQRELYRPWALAASSEADFTDVVNLMLGELNASHMGYSGGDEEDGETTGWIGALFDPTAGGPGLLISEVLDDSPADSQEAALRPGERLLAVGDAEVTPDTSVYAHFADTVGQRLPLEIQGLDGKRRRAVVVPVRAYEMRQQRYRQWTRQRRALVERLSEGRLGYLHIQGMDIPSFEEFERDLYAAGHGKEGLIIDVRSNGGGWTTDYLMAVLTVQRHARTVPRGADPGVASYPQSRLPLAAWTRPALTVCDEQSYSNAEIFTHAFKSLQRGLVVGQETFGAVISTGGTGLLNGGFVRLPFRGWYVAGNGANMELGGAVPDVVVELPPQQETAADRDAQLERAVEIFLEGLEQDPRYGAW